MALLAPLVAGAAVLSAAAAPSASRGRQIYLRGEGGKGPGIAASIDGWQSQVPASLLACASCHGNDGEGRPEGGVTPSPLTWEQLTKPYAVEEGGGRSRPPYTGSSLARAIMTGIDSAGRPLQSTMPRFRMSGEQLRDLIAYLKRLGNTKEPGLTDHRLAVGMFVPSSGPQQKIGEAMQQVVRALFDRANAQGGLYGRKLELRVLPSEDGARALDGQQVFALLGGLSGVTGLDVAALAEEKEIPLIAPVITDPEPGSPARRFSFYLFPGLREQALALAAFAGQQAEKKALHALVVYPETPRASSLAEGIEAYGREAGWAGAKRIGYPEGRPDPAAVVTAGKKVSASALFFLGSPAEAAALLSEAAKRSFTPAVFLEGLQAGRELSSAPGAFENRLFLAFPGLPLSRGTEAEQDFHALPVNQAPPGMEAFQLWAYAGGRILLEALRTAGRRLDREKLITSLEGLYDFETGTAAPVRFGPGRRVGTSGATIVRLDPRVHQLVVVRQWVNVEK